MAFLEHSVFQNKDIGVVFSTLFIYTLHVKWEHSGGIICTVFLIRSTGQNEAGCICNVGRRAVHMHCWYHAT